VSNTFLAYHIRKQLSYDLWWLFFAVWVICIVERAQLQDSSKSTWFTIFSVMFEVVSGYATVGISLGVPFVCNIQSLSLILSYLFIFLDA
jgi:Trk-type K+ transport system membrane component